MATLCLKNCISRLVPLLPELQVRWSGLLRPRKSKFRKFHKRFRCVKPAKPDHVDPPPLHFYDHGLYALEGKRITAAQIEACRLTLVRTLGRKNSSIRLCIFPHIPVTKKPLGVRMGKGKGNVDHFVAFVKAGKMLFEFSENINAKKAHRAVGYKLPIKIGYVEKKIKDLKTHTDTHTDTQ